MKEILVATRNKKKLKEIKRLFKNIRIKVISLANFPDLPKVVENKKTFKGNALKKAIEISRLINKITLADDSGLEVLALNMRPGVYSARYAGPKKNDKLNCKKLLRELKNKPIKKRKARFKCVIAITKGRITLKIVHGICKGRIGFEIKGKTGFGYDPVFIPSGYKRTFAELGPKIKDKLSHRGKALGKAKRFIEAHLLRAL